MTNSAVAAILEQAGGRSRYSRLSLMTCGQMKCLFAMKQVVFAIPIFRHRPC